MAAMAEAPAAMAVMAEAPAAALADAAKQPTVPDMQQRHPRSSVSQPAGWRAHGRLRVLASYLWT
jgi:hypothetical protein